MSIAATQNDEITSADPPAATTGEEKAVELRDLLVESATGNSGDTVKRRVLNVYVLHSSAMGDRATNVDALQSALESATADTNPSLVGRVRVMRVLSQEPQEIQASPELLKTSVDFTGFKLLPTSDGEAASENPVESGKARKQRVEMLQSLANNSMTLHLNQLSNALKHLTAMRMIVESSTPASPESADAEDIHVIVEDDVLFNGTTLVTQLLDVIDKAPNDTDVLFLGLPATKQGRPDHILYDAIDDVFAILPSCESYMITPSAARAIVGEYLPLRFPTHVHLTCMLERARLRAYSCSPSVFLDGSKIGVFTSSIEQNNALVWNQGWSQIHRLLFASQPSPWTAGVNWQLWETVDPTSKETFPKETFDEIMRLHAASPCREHPDFRHLMALVYTRRGVSASISPSVRDGAEIDDGSTDWFEVARKEFQTAYEMYASQKCIMTRDSAFLRNYIRLHKRLQTGI
jgi:hypothetical protein